jgi:hypothetical protein
MRTCRNCAFVNFTNISNAIKAIDGVKNKPEYANLRIAHGKDRCANPPRSGPQGASGARRSASGGGGPNSAVPDGEDGEEAGEVGLKLEDSDAVLLGAGDEDEGHLVAEAVKPESAHDMTVDDVVEATPA